MTKTDILREFGVFEHSKKYDNKPMRKYYKSFTAAGLYRKAYKRRNESESYYIWFDKGNSGNN